MTTFTTRSRQDLVEQVIGIANEFILAGEGIQKCGQSLIDMLALVTDLARNGDYEQALGVCEMASDVSNLGVGYQGGLDMYYAQGVVNYFLAVTFIGKGDDERALKQFHSSSEKLKGLYPHAAAAVWIATAELQLDLEEFDKAIWSLQRSANLFELKPSPYRRAQALKVRVSECYARAKSGLARAARTKPPRSTKTSPDSILAFETLRLFPVFGSMSAGPGIWISPSADGFDFVEVERLRIKDKPYQILNLKSESKTLPLERSKIYGVAQVVGNSMNNLTTKLKTPRKIESGDYVLLAASHSGTYEPKEMEVVAARIPDASGARGVIKRYRTLGGEPWLLSESTDAMETNFSVRGSQAEIFAQVIAVLKPMDEKK